MARFLIPLLLLFSLSACDYDAEPLPDKITADYELAIPIADTTFTIIDFFQSSNIPPSQINLPSGSSIHIVVDYPFYLANFTENNYKIHWVKPKAIIDNQFPSIVDISLSCYISTLNHQQYSLANNHLLAAKENTLFTDIHIGASGFPIAEANRLYVVIGLKTTKDTSVQELLDNMLKVSFGLRIGLQINRAF